MGDTKYTGFETLNKNNKNLPLNTFAVVLDYRLIYCNLAVTGLQAKSKKNYILTLC